MPVQLGLQLFSVRKSLASDPWGTLRQLSAAGFTALEAANHSARTDPGVGFGVGAAELRDALAELGMRIVGCHINPLDLDLLPQALDYQVELGNQQIGCDIEFYPYGDVDYVLRRAETFNQVGRLCAERGMRFYYHNHYQEFQEFRGRLVYEVLLENTDPDLVSIEMDTYWVYRGGHDPIEWMRRYPERVILLHQKDFPADAPQPLSMYDGVVARDAQITMDSFDQTLNPLCFIEVGTGVLPIASLIEAASALPNLDYLLLEQDHTTLDEIESVRISQQTISAYPGVS